MSGLNPGGSRSKGPRAFTPMEVKMACIANKVADAAKPCHSIADQPHAQNREVARRLRQQAKAK